MKKIVAYTFALCIALGMVSFAVALPPGGGPVGGGIIPGGPLTATTLSVTTLNESNATAVDTYSDGVTLSNTTAATNGHNAYSPCINLHGHGWKTNATAASVGTDWLLCNLPVNGAAAPTTELYFNSSTADTPSYTNRMKLDSAGVLTLTAVPTLPTQTANYVFAGPTTGSAAAPAFRALVDADIPNTITIDLAATATALAANPADCAANQFATTIAASGALTCAAIVDNDVPDTITASNYLPLAGGTMVGNLIFTDNSYDIGASGATRPRTGYFGTDVNVGGDVNVTDDLTCNQATMTVNAIGATQGTTPANETKGVLLTNTTASVVGPGVTSQVSPPLVWHGSAFNSVSGLSETHDWRAYVLPVTVAGATNATWILGSSLNGANYASLMRLNHKLDNVSVGVGAGLLLSSGEVNTFIGSQSGATCSTNSGSVGVGYYAMVPNVSYGVGVGYNAGRYADSHFQVYIDNRDRSTSAASKTDSLIYGVTGATTTGYLQNIALNGGVISQNAAAFGGGARRTVRTKHTEDATAFNVWENTNTVVLATGAIPSVVTALVAESCVNINVRCTAVDLADTAGNGSWQYEDLCCNKAGTTTCSAGATAIRAVAAGTLAAATVAILPCNTVAGSCTTADAPGVAITGVAATHVNWKCVIDTFVTDNT